MHLACWMSRMSNRAQACDPPKLPKTPLSSVKQQKPRAHWQNWSFNKICVGCFNDQRCILSPISSLSPPHPPFPTSQGCQMLMDARMPDLWAFPHPQTCPDPYPAPHHQRLWEGEAFPSSRGDSLKRVIKLIHRCSLSLVVVCCCSSTCCVSKMNPLNHIACEKSWSESKKAS